jgi:hypothetical protein
VVLAAVEAIAVLEPVLVDPVKFSFEEEHVFVDSVFVQIFTRSPSGRRYVVQKHVTKLYIFRRICSRMPFYNSVLSNACAALRSHHLRASAVLLLVVGNKKPIPLQSLNTDGVAESVINKINERF